MGSGTKMDFWHMMIAMMRRDVLAGDAKVFERVNLMGFGDFVGCVSVCNARIKNLGR